MCNARHDDYADIAKCCRALLGRYVERVCLDMGTWDLDIGSTGFIWHIIT